MHETHISDEGIQVGHKDIKHVEDGAEVEPVVITSVTPRADTASLSPNEGFVAWLQVLASWCLWFASWYASIFPLTLLFSSD